MPVHYTPSGLSAPALDIDVVFAYSVRSPDRYPLRVECGGAPRCASGAGRIVTFVLTMGYVLFALTWRRPSPI